MWGYSASESKGKNAFGYEPKIYSEEPNARTTVRGSGSGPLGTNNDWTWAYGSPSDMKQAYQQKASGGSRGGYAGGGGFGSARSSTTTQRLRFTEDAPDLPTLPKLEMPKVDKRKIRALTQQIAAPNIRKLNESVLTAMNIHTDNPNVRRMTLREALQGYGSGLESTMAGAGGQARSEHQQELNLASAEAQANWRANTEALMSQYNNAWQKYLAGAERVSETNASDTPMDGGTAGNMVVRRNVWGTPYLAPDFQTAYRNRIPTSY